MWSRNLKFWYRNWFFYVKKCKQNSSIAHRWVHEHFRLSVSGFLGGLLQRVVHIFWKELTEELLFLFLTCNSSQNWRNFSFQYVFTDGHCSFPKGGPLGKQNNFLIGSFRSKMASVLIEQVFWLANFDPKMSSAFWCAKVFRFSSQVYWPKLLFCFHLTKV